MGMEEGDLCRLYRHSEVVWDGKRLNGQDNQEGAWVCNIG